MASVVRLVLPAPGHLAQLGTVDQPHTTWRPHNWKTGIPGGEEKTLVKDLRGTSLESLEVMNEGT